MFQQASSFNANLCAWGSRLASTLDFKQMFYDSGCPFRYDVVWNPFAVSPPGPFCQSCGPLTQSLMSAIEAPVEVPLVPAALANLLNGSVMAWSASARYSFGKEAGPVKTYMSMIDPTTGASTLRNVTGNDRTCLCRGLPGHAKAHGSSHTSPLLPPFPPRFQKRYGSNLQPNLVANVAFLSHSHRSTIQSPTALLGLG
jgi:hypothetical protein